MSARKPDGSRWFRPTAAELMDRWLEDSQLLDWLENARELPPSMTQESFDELLQREITAQLKPLVRNLLKSPRLQAAVLEGMPAYWREILRSDKPDN